jgi:hypothetical protein
MNVLLGTTDRDSTNHFDACLQIGRVRQYSSQLTLGSMRNVLEHQNRTLLFGNSIRPPINIREVERRSIASNTAIW